ncbi:MAG: hypothetical protein ACK2U5_19010 [Candidatus Promineifilaceae bacterium]
MAPSSPSAQVSPFTPLTREEELRLWPLAVHAGHLLQTLRFVDYRQAENDAALLALRLRDRFSPEELRRMAFAGLPRGGFIVLAMLAYQLDLRPDQLQPLDYDSSDIICLVDDCSLSGLRLQQTLSNMAGKRAGVALLYSAAGLRAAVQERYPFVEFCLSAHDLAEKQPDGSLSEDGRMESLLDGRLYAGPLETVAFAWNEPDLMVLTPFDEQPASEWRFVPPHKCLKNRAALSLPPIAAGAADEWIVPDGIVYGWFDGLLYLLNTTKQQVFRLDNFAAGCWRALAGYGSLETAVQFLQQSHPDLDISQTKSNLTANLSHFEAAGLLISQPTP